jgi:O-antigen/teichoic acid export membrane protein
MDNLKTRAIHGGIAKLTGQGASLVIRVASIAVLARLLSPADFGLVAMMTVVTGLFDILSSAGLSPATVQSAVISDQQRSNLFWINIACSFALGLCCILAAPLIVIFYNEPQLLWVAPAFALIFIVNGLGAQHSALLERQLRYGTLTRFEVTGQFVNASVAILLAWYGAGYWALIFGLIAQSLAMTSAFWWGARWIPGLPHRGTPVGPLLRFGATVSLNQLIVFLAYNVEKILIGRYWGAPALGVYGRAYQLINLPTASLNTAVAGVALSSLSRLQSDPVRHRQYFLKGYSLLLSLTVPLTIFAALFGDDIIRIALGPNWMEAVPIFRLLTPTVLIFGVINPLSALLLSCGMQTRSLHLALAISVLMIGAVTLGIPYGPTGVAFAFSTAMGLWLVPHVFWCLKGMLVRPRDLAIAFSKPLAAALTGGAVAFLVHAQLLDLQWPIARLGIAGIVMAGVHLGVLIFVLGERKAYSDVFQEFRGLAFSRP